MPFCVLYAWSLFGSTCGTEGTTFLFQIYIYSLKLQQVSFPLNNLSVLRGGKGFLAFPYALPDCHFSAVSPSMRSLLLPCPSTLAVSYLFLHTTDPSLISTLFLHHVRALSLISQRKYVRQGHHV